MALQGSGAISLDDMHVEAGGTTGTQCSLNDSDIRAMISKADGAQASFSEYYNAASEVDIAITLSSNTNNYNIYSNRGASYSAGKSNITLTINSGVTVGSTSTGTPALDTGTGWSSGDTITIVNNGAVRGRGGNGGIGASCGVNSSGSYVSSSSATAGGTGGTAFKAQFATTITNNGTFAGGGGGGGGGRSGNYYQNDPKFGISFNARAGGGGGGGAGVNGGSGGSGGTASAYYRLLGGTVTADTSTAASGSGGSATTGGSGANGIANDSLDTAWGELAGGAGGAAGSNGSSGVTQPMVYFTQRESAGSGGTRGKYAEGNSNITWSVTGTRQGAVS